MNEAPSLFFLCLDSIKDCILYGDDNLSFIYEFPPEIFDSLLTRLPPAALQKLQNAEPAFHRNEQEVDCQSQRKRKRFGRVEIQLTRKCYCRCDNFETAWRKLYESHFPGFVRNYLVDGSVVPKVPHGFEIDWQEMYWECHIQFCLDEATEKAALPYFEGHLGEIKLSDKCVKTIGYERCQSNSKEDCTKLSHHCQQFGLHVRCLMLHSVLFCEETSHLLRNCELQTLTVRLIKSREQVEGLCKVLRQNGGTLRSIGFIHCRLLPEFVNEICDSLYVKDLQTHRIHDLSINASRFLGSSIPSGLASLLSARSLSSLSFRDSQLQQTSAKMIFSLLLEASSSIEVLDLSENNISGWLSDLKWKSSRNAQLISRMNKTLKSLRVLKLRSNNLRGDDAECLECALVHMPNLKKLDLSDNFIADDGIKSLIPYFVGISESVTPLTDLKLGECTLTSDGVSQLLQVLSTFRRPLDSLDISGNNLGSEMGESLGKFMCTSARALDIRDVELGSSGFVEAKEQLKEGMDLISINISNNNGGVEAAKFISKLITSAPGLLKVDASHNFMPVESVSIICSSLEITKGKLLHLDLTGNVSCSQADSILKFEKYKENGTLTVTFDNIDTAYPLLYDHDP